jgi:hypothetical protein
VAAKPSLSEWYPPSAFHDAVALTLGGVEHIGGVGLESLGDPQRERHGAARDEKRDCVAWRKDDLLFNVAKNLKPAYLIKRVDNGGTLEGPFRERIRAERRADRLAETLGLALFVHSRNAYGKWRVWYRTDREALIIDLERSQYQTEEPLLGVADSHGRAE